MKEQKETNLNAYASEFGPKRNTAVITDARHWNGDINAINDNESDIW